MNDEQDWIEAYKQMSNKIANDHPTIKMIDLWREQPYYDDLEYPLDKVAVFFSFNASDIKTLPQGVQQIPMQVKVYTYFETLADTHRGAFNQDKALKFAEWLRKVNKSLHGWSDTHFSDLTRTAINQEQSVSGAIIYSQTYATEIMDYSAERETELVDYTDEDVNLDITPGEVTKVDNWPRFDLS